MDALPDYLETFPNIIGKKTERQRTVAFNVRDRAEMALVVLFPMLMFLGGPLFLLFIILNLWGWILPFLLESVFYYLGIFLLWPKIPARIGPKKVVIYSTIFMFALLIGSWVSTQSMESTFSSAFPFNDVLAALNWWPLQVFMVVLAVMLWYDADGSTPTQRSTLLANAWNKGKTKVLERWGSHVSPTQYGIITARIELCTGCGDCVDVCPMLIPEVEIENRKVRLRNPDHCINCRACINQCPTNTLFLAPETEAARLALEHLQNK